MEKLRKRGLNTLITLTILSFLFVLGTESLTYARAGGGRSMGSRGFSSGRTYQRTTPVQPSRTYKQQTAPQNSAGQQNAPSFGRSMLYGLGGGLLGGMLGSMLFGGHGYAGGAGGGSAGFGLGDFIIILIIIGIIYFFLKRYRARRQEMQMSAAGENYGSYGYGNPAVSEQAYELSEPSAKEDSLSLGLRHISNMDPSFNENKFKELVEDIFFKIQGAWTKRDMNVVRDLMAPSMFNTFQNDVNSYISNKQLNHLENIAVRKVEIVDAAQDQGEEYITIKFLASLLDYTTDESSNSIISGSSTEPVKFLEYWTFSRKIGSENWLLAGITQENDY